MSSRQFRIDLDIDWQGVVAAFVFGLAIGVLMVYAALPPTAQLWDPATLQNTRAGPITGPLLVGVAMFAFFFLGVFILNWLFMNQDS